MELDDAVEFVEHTAAIVADIVYFVDIASIVVAAVNAVIVVVVVVNAVGDFGP